MFAVTVQFTLHPGKMQAFLPLVLGNARASRDREPGCHQFDVCTDPDRPDAVFLYELYRDEAAFEHHQSMPHYAEFGASAGDMIAEKHIETFAQVTR